MRQNVFAKMATRRLSRTLLLALLLLMATFAFVARVAEYIIVSQELRRAEGYFASIGVMTPIQRRDFTNDHDVSMAAALIGNSPLVDFGDRRTFVQGSLHENRNVIAQFTAENHLIPYLEGMNIASHEHIFYATLSSNEPTLLSMGGHRNSLRVSVYPTEILVGDRVTMHEDIRVFVSGSGVVHSFTNRVDMRIPITNEEAVLFEAGLFNPFADVMHNQPVLFRALPHLRPTGDGFTIDWIVRPFFQEDGLALIPEPISGTLLVNVDPTLYRENIEDLVFYSIAGSIGHDRIRAQIQPHIDLVLENFQSMLVVGTQSMENMPRFQNPATGRLNRGRWLTYEDYINQNAVAVLPIQMATREGLWLGETFTITLRDGSRPHWIDQDSDSRFSFGAEGWWTSVAQGWWASSENNEDRHNYVTHEITVEVVGLYWPTAAGALHSNYATAEIYIPASLIPEGFGWNDVPLLTGMYSFMLNSARDEQAFISRYEHQLEILGFRPRFLASGFESFATSTDPLMTSITANLVIFTMLSLLVIIFVAYLHLRERRNTIAVCRALGVPVKNIMRQMFVPSIITWLPAIAVGAVFAWFFAINEAETSIGIIARALDPSSVAVVEGTGGGISWLVLAALGLVLFCILATISSYRLWKENNRRQNMSGVIRKILAPFFPVWYFPLLLATALVSIFAYNSFEGDFTLLWSQATHSFNLDNLYTSGIAPNVSILIFIVSAIVVVIFAVLIGAGFVLAHRPVLEQLQGGLTSRKKIKSKTKKVNIDNDIPANFNPKNLEILRKRPTFSKIVKIRAGFEHVIRHILRSPLKTTVVALMSLFFVLSLGWIHHTIVTTQQELDYHWENFQVHANIIRSPEDERVMAGRMMYYANAPLTQMNVDRILNSGYVGEIYLEALWYMSFLRSEENMGNLHQSDTTFDATDLIFAINSLEGFIEYNARTTMDDALGVWGEDAQIYFATGFSIEDFVFESHTEITPVVVRESFLQSHGYNLGDILFINNLLYEGQGVHVNIAVQVIGYFTGGLSRAADRFTSERSVILMPLEALQQHTQRFLPQFTTTRFLTYMTANIIIDPAMNRELQGLHNALDSWLTNNRLGSLGAMPLELIIHDRQLRSIVDPLEQNLQLLTLLFPIAITIAIALSVIIPILVILQAVKNAALMRALGQSRLRSFVANCGEYLLVCLLGVILGISGLLVVTTRLFDPIALLLAVLYFGGAIIGSLVGSAVVVAKTPLELLQAKE